MIALKIDVKNEPNQVIDVKQNVVVIVNGTDNVKLYNGECEVTSKQEQRSDA